MNDEHVVAFGYRDTAEQTAHGSPPLPPHLHAIDFRRIHSRGITLAAKEAVPHLTRDHGPDNGFWRHVDADLLDDAIMPAVDYRLPDGFSWEELTTALRIATNSDRVVGLEVTIYNPTLDPHGGRTWLDQGHRRRARVIGLAILVKPRDAALLHRVCRAATVPASVQSSR